MRVAHQHLTDRWARGGTRPYVVVICRRHYAQHLSVLGQVLDARGEECQICEEERVSRSLVRSEKEGRSSPEELQRGRDYLQQLHRELVALGLREEQSPEAAE